MAPTEEGRKGCWIRRFRRKETDLFLENNPSCRQGEVLRTVDHHQRRTEKLKSRLSRKISRSVSDRTVLKWMKGNDESVQIQDKENGVLGDVTFASNDVTVASKDGNLQKMSIDLETHQKCVTNLAATVVRQNQKIHELTTYIENLLSLLEDQHTPPESSDLSDVGYSPTGQLSSSSSIRRPNAKDVNRRWVTFGDDEWSQVWDPTTAKAQMLRSIESQRPFHRPTQSQTQQQEFFRNDF